MTDAEILLSLKNKDNDIGIKALLKHFKITKTHILNNSGTKQDAEDIFQDVLVIFINKVQQGNLELTCSISTYLIAIAKNLWLNHLKHLNKLPLQTFVMDNIVNDVDFEQEKKFKLAEIAYQTLGEQCKNLLYQFYILKQDFQAIAAKLNFSTALVAKNQKYRCMQKAKEEFLNLNKNN